MVKKNISRRKNKSLFIYKKEDLSSVLVNNPLDILTILLGFVSLLVMSSLYFFYMGNTDFPSVSDDSMSLFFKGIIGITLMIFARVFLYTLNKKDVYKNMVGLTFDPGTGLGDLKSHISDTVFAILSYFSIQMIGLILQNINIFQTTALNIYAFYFSSAVIEELLFRGGIIMFMQALFVKMIPVKGDAYPYLQSALAGLISSIAFLLVHQRYFDNPVFMIVTFLGGVSQAIFYFKSKNLFIPIIAHVVVNLVAAGGLIQSL